MGAALDIAIMVNNYSHDIATAFLVVSAVALWIISASYPQSSDKADELYFVEAHQAVSRAARYSLVWVLLAGVPRVIFYKRYEWSNIAGYGQVPAILAKHVVIFVLVVLGIYYWVRVRKRVRSIRLKHVAGGDGNG